MSFLKCIQDKVDAKTIAPRDAKILQNKFETLRKRYTRTMGDENAAAQAANDIVETESIRLAQKKKKSDPTRVDSR